ncbi:MAG: hypothetical protein M1814_005615 [Vezdaea aestivalis]|nr:MAG: hypothetical protein M1814_005615 [Vezdaea aestivalis]
MHLSTNRKNRGLLVWHSRLISQRRISLLHVLNVPSIPSDASHKVQRKHSEASDHEEDSALSKGPSRSVITQGRIYPTMNNSGNYQSGASHPQEPVYDQGNKVAMDGDLNNHDVERDARALEYAEHMTGSRKLGIRLTLKSRMIRNQLQNVFSELSDVQLRLELMMDAHNKDEAQNLNNAAEQLRTLLTRAISLYAEYLENEKEFVSQQRELFEDEDAFVKEFQSRNGPARLTRLEDMANSRDKVMKTTEPFRIFRRKAQAAFEEAFQAQLTSKRKLDTAIAKGSTHSLVFILAKLHNAQSRALAFDEKMKVMEDEFDTRQYELMEDENLFIDQYSFSEPDTYSDSDDDDQREGGPSNPYPAPPKISFLSSVPNPSDPILPVASQSFADDEEKIFQSYGEVGSSHSLKTVIKDDWSHLGNRLPPDPNVLVALLNNDLPTDRFVLSLDLAGYHAPEKDLLIRRASTNSFYRSAPCTSSDDWLPKQRALRFPRASSTVDLSLISMNRPPFQSASSRFPIPKRQALEATASLSTSHNLINDWLLHSMRSISTLILLYEAIRQGNNNALPRWRGSQDDKEDRDLVLQSWQDDGNISMPMTSNLSAYEWISNSTLLVAKSEVPYNRIQIRTFEMFRRRNFPGPPNPYDNVQQLRTWSKERSSPEIEERRSEKQKSVFINWKQIAFSHSSARPFG